MVLIGRFEKMRFSHAAIDEKDDYLKHRCTIGALRAGSANSPPEATGTAEPKTTSHHFAQLFGGSRVAQQPHTHTTARETGFRLDTLDSPELAFPRCGAFARVAENR